MREDEVTCRRSIACYVTKSPNGLFGDIDAGRVEELLQFGDGFLLDDGRCLLGGAGGDVCQRPARFELKRRARNEEKSVL